MPSAGPADVTRVVISSTTFDYGCGLGSPFRPGPARFRARPGSIVA